MRHARPVVVILAGLALPIAALADAPDPAQAACLQPKPLTDLAPKADSPVTALPEGATPLTEGAALTSADSPDGNALTASYLALRQPDGTWQTYMLGEEGLFSSVSVEVLAVGDIDGDGSPEVWLSLQKGDNTRPGSFGGTSSWSYTRHVLLDVRRQRTLAVVPTRFTQASSDPISCGDENMCGAADLSPEERSQMMCDACGKGTKPVDVRRSARLDGKTLLIEGPASALHPEAAKLYDDAACPEGRFVWKATGWSAAPPAKRAP